MKSAPLPVFPTMLAIPSLGAADDMRPVSRFSNSMVSYRYANRKVDFLTRKTGVGLPHHPHGTQRPAEG
jgi:hypothetical protein